MALVGPFPLPGTRHGLVAVPLFVRPTLADRLDGVDESETDKHTGHVSHQLNSEHIEEVREQLQ